ncbi:MAG: hypothetical protein NVS1B14_06910 [Vulcanimicrobiaceae bacterium]
MTQTANRPEGATDEPRWHASLGVLAALFLYVTLPPRLIIGPLWLVPLLVLLVLVPLSVLSPKRHRETVEVRIASILLIALLNVFNVASAVLLVWAVLHPQAGKLEGAKLMAGGMQIWLTNILVFALWYWELDAGGPERRAHCSSAATFERVDFLFPQMGLGVQSAIAAVWKPLFWDYVFLAFTNATAFSPADTFPLTRLAKLLVLAEALISFTTIGIIVARAVNILGS